MYVACDAWACITQDARRHSDPHLPLARKPTHHPPPKSANRLQYSFEEMTRFTYWVLETVTAASSHANGYITAIWDCQGQGYKVGVACSIFFRFGHSRSNPQPHTQLTNRPTNQPTHEPQSSTEHGPDAGDAPGRRDRHHEELLPGVPAAPPDLQRQHRLPVRSPAAISMHDDMSVKSTPTIHLVY